MSIPNLKTRREFLRSSLIGGALSWTVPTFIARTFSSLHSEAADSAIAPVTGRDGTILVVLQMAGGNDGLNTVVPFANDYYLKARPGLSLGSSSVLKLNETFGLHPGMSAFKEFYESGRLSIVHGVGYPNPNRSHFRSTEIWQTASDSNKSEKYGWLGRYFDNACKGADPTVGINIGKQMPQAFASSKPIGVSLDNPESYRFASNDETEIGKMSPSEHFFRQLNKPDAAGAESMDNAGGSIASVPGKIPQNTSPLDYLERTALDAQVSSDKILAVSKRAQNQATYPASQLANSLKLVARLIGGGLATRVFYVSQGGYDTHANQKASHDRLLSDLSESVKSFTSDLKAQGNSERVLIMTFSEFGRRLAQNANGGTDHGAAAPMFLIGPKVKAGFMGNFPSLAPADLFNGDLKFTTDFRSVYATVLEQWLKTDSVPVLGRNFASLPVV
jgi:uncharacterized protein (DUF1501 family)